MAASCDPYIFFPLWRIMWRIMSCTTWCVIICELISPCSFPLWFSWRIDTSVCLSEREAWLTERRESGQETGGGAERRWYRICQLPATCNWPKVRCLVFNPLPVSLPSSQSPFCCVLSYTVLALYTVYRDQQTNPDWSSSRRPDESVWEWYLRHKRTIGDSIQQKISRLASAQRGYELSSFVDAPSEPTPSEPVVADRKSVV